MHVQKECGLEYVKCKYCQSCERKKHEKKSNRHPSRQHVKGYTPIRIHDCAKQDGSHNAKIKPNGEQTKGQLLNNYSAMDGCVDS